MKQLIKENGVVIGLLIFWLFTNLILLMLSKDTENSREMFYPFTDKGISNTYDITEFLVYGISPMVIFVILQLIKYEKS